MSVNEFLIGPRLGVIWGKNLVKNCDFAVDASFLLGFAANCYQTWYIYSTTHSAS